MKDVSSVIPNIEVIQTKRLTSVHGQAFCLDYVQILVTLPCHNRQITLVPDEDGDGIGCRCTVAVNGLQGDNVLTGL